MKKIIILLMFIAASVLVFADNEDQVNTIPTQSNDISNSVDIRAQLGTIWGYDLNTNHSGFQEIIDIDLMWEISPWKDYASDISNIEWGKPYGMAMISGAHLNFNVLDQVGDLATNSEEITINYEKIWGKIVWDPFYLLVASSTKGNHFNRISNWSFATSNDRIRADWAHIGYRLQWAGLVSTSIWSLSGSADSVSTEAATAGLGLGCIIDKTEMLLSVGTPSDWETNENDEYDIGFSVESNPVGDLMVQASAVTGFNYDVMPLGMALGFGYNIEINPTFSFVPYLAFDGKYTGTEEDAFDQLASEVSLGLTLTWPGATGFGYEPLANMDSNRFSGITLSGNYYTPAKEEPTSVTSMVLSLFEETIGGIVPNVGASAVYELYNVTAEDSEDIKHAYGLYLDYNLEGIGTPYTRIKRTSDNSTSSTSLELGAKISMIPNSIITVKYENDLDLEADDLGTEFEANKGLVSVEVLVTF